MSRVVALVLCAGFTSPAWASEVTLFDGDDPDALPDDLLPPAAWAPWMASGPQAVSLAFDDQEGRWVMLFEALMDQDSALDLDPAFGNCGIGPDGTLDVRALGRASTADPRGLSGWVVDTNPALVPEPGTWAACAVRDPRLLPIGETWHLFFTAEQLPEPCPSPDEVPAWGCDRRPGIGRLTSIDAGRTFDPIERDVPHILAEGPGLGASSVVMEQAPGARWGDFSVNLILERQGDLYLATALGPEGPFDLEDEPVLQPGTWAFAEDRWEQPALTCGPPDTPFPIQLWVVGATDGGSSGAEELRAPDDPPTEWLGDGAPVVAFPGAPTWVDHEVLRVGPDAWQLLVVAETDSGTALLGARVADTPDFAALPTDAGDRACLYGEPPSDEPRDTDDPIDPGDPDDPDDPPLEGCYCGLAGPAGAPGAAWPLAVLAMLGLRARRRR